MWEDLECDGEISNNFDVDGTGQQAYSLMYMTIHPTLVL
jgi:hypothetical protein